MVQVDKRSHLVLFKQNQRNHDPYTSGLQKAYKTDYLVNRHNMMGTVSKLYVLNNTWIYVYIKNLKKFQLQLPRVSTPIPTPTLRVSTPTPTPTPASLLNINSNSNSNSGSFNSNSNSNSGKSLEYQLQLQLQLRRFQLQFQLQLRSWSWSWTQLQLQLRSWPQPWSQMIIEFASEVSNLAWGVSQSQNGGAIFTLTKWSPMFGSVVFDYQWCILIVMSVKSSFYNEYDIKNNENMCCWLNVVFKITTRRSTIDVRKKSDLSRKNLTTGSPGHVRKIWDWPQPVSRWTVGCSRQM